MAMTQLERYRATVNHKRPDKLLYKFGCIPELRERLREHLGLEEEASLIEHFGLYLPRHIGMRRPEDYPPPDFSEYYRCRSAGRLHD